MIVDDQIGSLFLTYIIQVVGRQRPAGGFMEYKETGLCICVGQIDTLSLGAPLRISLWGPSWVGAARGENSEFPSDGVRAISHLGVHP